jgi:hypothetical protein
MEAAAMEPPEYEKLEGCAALGGVRSRSSPLCFLLVMCHYCETQNEFKGALEGLKEMYGKGY